MKSSNQLHAEPWVRADLSEIDKMLSEFLLIRLEQYHADEQLAAASAIARLLRLRADKLEAA